MYIQGKNQFWCTKCLILQVNSLFGKYLTIYLYIKCAKSQNLVLIIFLRVDGWDCGRMLHKFSIDLKKKNAYIYQDFFVSECDYSHHGKMFTYSCGIFTINFEEIDADGCYSGRMLHKFFIGNIKLLNFTPIIFFKSECFNNHHGMLLMKY